MRRSCGCKVGGERSYGCKVGAEEEAVVVRLDEKKKLWL